MTRNRRARAKFALELTSIAHTSPVPRNTFPRLRDSALRRGSGGAKECETSRSRVQGFHALGRRGWHLTGTRRVLRLAHDG